MTALITELTVQVESGTVALKTKSFKFNECPIGTAILLQLSK